MVPVAERAGIANNRNGSPGGNLVSHLFAQLAVVLVGGEYVACVLYGDGITILVAPSGVGHGAVQCGFHHGIGRCGDVHGRVGSEIETVGDTALERGEEMHSLDGEIALLAS